MRRRSVLERRLNARRCPSPERETDRTARSQTATFVGSRSGKVYLLWRRLKSYYADTSVSISTNSSLRYRAVMAQPPNVVDLVNLWGHGSRRLSGWFRIKSNRLRPNHLKSRGEKWPERNGRKVVRSCVAGCGRRWLAIPKREQPSEVWRHPGFDIDSARRMSAHDKA